MLLKPNCNIGQTGVFGHVKLHKFQSTGASKHRYTRTPGDITMPGPLFVAGKSKALKVNPSRVLNSTLRRGRLFTVIAIFRAAMSWSMLEAGNDGYCLESN